MIKVARFTGNYLHFVFLNLKTPDTSKSLLLRLIYKWKYEHCTRTDITVY